MDDRSADESARDAERAAPAPSAPAPAPARKRHRWMLGIASVVLIPVLLFALWCVITLNWNYSEGNRAGYVQKFSRKGWLCKTWEGELQITSIPGSAPQIFAFTVRDDSVAQAITRMMGSHVSLSYQEHKGVPTSCFGETSYYVNSVKPVTMPGAVTPPVPPAP